MGIADSLYEDIKKQGFEKIEEMVSRNESESTYIDYKLVNTIFYDGTPEEGRKRSADKISQSDKSNLGKAISGFANSEGGIIVWGVECKDKKDGRGDVPSSFQFEIELGSRGDISPFPLNRFKALLEDCTQYCTIPVSREVYHTVVPKERGIEGETKEGVVVTHVKEAQHDVIKCVVDNNGQYYMRVGSSFKLLPHSVMAARFGRKPFPEIVPRMYLEEIKNGNYYEFVCRFCLIIENCGEGVARDYYIFFNFPGMRDAIRSCLPYEKFIDLHYENYFMTSGISSDVDFPYLISTKEPCIIPPRYKRKFIFSLKFKRHLNNPSCKDFVIKVETGTSDSKSNSSTLRIEWHDIYKIMDNNLILNPSDGSYVGNFTISDEIKKIISKYALDSESRN